MDSQKKFDLIAASPTEEILTEGDVKTAIEMDLPLKHYIGFEISGLLHIGQGLLSAIKIADLQKAGVDCSIFLADYHSWINEKLGGDLELIRKTAANYYKEAFKTAIEVAGGDPDKVKFVLGSELYDKLGNKYWTTALEVAKNNNLARIMRSITIAGRKEGETINFAILWYPVMQVADIFAQQLNIAHAGMDQRKAHVIARDVAGSLKYSMPLKRKHDNHEEVYKPMALHQHLILGLLKPPVWPIPKDKIKEVVTQMKMSKSKPDSAVFLTDSEDNIKRKLMGAFCPEKYTGYNPVLDWTKHLVFKLNHELTIERPQKFGGKLHFSNYEELEKLYAEGKLHPVDLKNAVGEEIAEILAPIRKKFSQKKYHDMFENLERITRGTKL
jgi:tyrosyl-tRNA synthetase